MSGILSAFTGGSYGSPPVNTVAPVVSGTATVGQTLSTTNGTWTGVPTPTFTYQWQRAGSNIGSATSSTYTLVAADVGSTIRCVVTGTNAIGASSANSNSTSAVAATVPGAPTIGTATSTGSTTATVTYTAPASNGGATITSYTAVSSPGSITGSLSTAGSGTITVSGLSPSTSYTFVVYATNSVGNSANSSSSNSITTSAATGQATYTSPGCYTWVVPAGVTSVSALAIGGGGGGVNWYGESSGGGGGGLGYRNNYAVTAGASWCVRVSPGGAGAFFPGNGGGQSYVRQNTGPVEMAYAYGGSARVSRNQGTVSGGGRPCFNTGGGNGGNANYVTGGGGAGGYSGNGGNGACNPYGYAGSGGGGGGGAGANGSCNQGSGNGGGVGIYGQGSNGSGTSFYGQDGGAGSSGSGKSYGGGGGGGINARIGPGPCCCYYTCCRPGQAGGGGAVRILWPGNTRSYPSTNTGDL